MELSLALVPGCTFRAVYVPKDRSSAHQNETKTVFQFTNTLRLDSIAFTVPLSDCQSLGVLDSTPWKTSLVKPPNPVTASFSKLGLFKSIFPPRPQ